jgi:hypothetical protein
MAVAVLVAFDSYLRVSEVEGIRDMDVEDVGVLAPARGEGGVSPGMSGTLLILPRTKTGEYQSVQVRRTQVAALVESWRRYVRSQSGGRPDARLFPDRATFRQLFAQAQCNLGWSKEKGAWYVPHSLRHGGASCDFLVWGGKRLEDIMFRGRWASTKSARHYIQMGPALLAMAMAGVPQWQREIGSSMGQVIRLFVTFPDEFPWVLVRLGLGVCGWLEFLRKSLGREQTLSLKEFVKNV